jgi:hypothetical protein
MIDADLRGAYTTIHTREIVEHHHLIVQTLVDSHTPSAKELPHLGYAVEC